MTKKVIPAILIGSAVGSEVGRPFAPRYFLDGEFVIGSFLRVAPIIGLLHHNRIHDICKAFVMEDNSELYAASLAIAVFTASVMQDPDSAFSIVIQQLKEKATNSMTMHNLEYCTQFPNMLESFSKRRGSAWQIATFATHCAYKGITSNSFKAGIEEAIRFEGDVDTRASLAGAIMGAKMGIDGIPDEWLSTVSKEDFQRLYKLDVEMQNSTW